MWPSPSEVQAAPGQILPLIVFTSIRCPPSSYGAWVTRCQVMLHQHAPDKARPRRRTHLNAVQTASRCRHAGKPYYSSASLPLRQKPLRLPRSLSRSEDKETIIVKDRTLRAQRSNRTFARTTQQTKQGRLECGCCIRRTEAGHYDAAVVEQAQLVVAFRRAPWISRRVRIAEERQQPRVIVSQQLLLTW